MNTRKIIISASRRTDIPAFYMEEFIAGLDSGEFRVENPYNKKEFTVEAKRENVCCIVFWSKDFGIFLDRYAIEIKKRGFCCAFLFTVNSESEILEPNLPSLKDRLYQAKMLAEEFGPRAVTWRFDPICFYRINGGRIENNLHQFEQIARFMAGIKVKRCITSFCDLYPKVMKRAESIPGFSFVDPSLSRKKEVIESMARITIPLGIKFELCCEPELAKAFTVKTPLRPERKTDLFSCPEEIGANHEIFKHDMIGPASCINAAYLTELSGEKASLARDTGQRKDKGCGCHASKDIGSYSRQPCMHSCLYCYANPVKKQNREPQWISNR